jgi:hypothetical protein
MNLYLWISSAHRATSGDASPAPSNQRVTVESWRGFIRRSLLGRRHSYLSRALNLRYLAYGEQERARPAETRLVALAPDVRQDTEACGGHIPQSGEVRRAGVSARCHPVQMAASPDTVPANAPGKSREISSVTRRDIFDFLRAEAGPWWGRLSEIEFLGQLYDLA